MEGSQEFLPDSHWLLALALPRSAWPVQARRCWNWSDAVAAAVSYPFAALSIPGAAGPQAQLLWLLRAFLLVLPLLQAPVRASALYCARAFDDGGYVPDQC
jgi:hypothetical protein